MVAECKKNNLGQDGEKRRQGRPGTRSLSAVIYLKEKRVRNWKARLEGEKNGKQVSFS